MSESHYCAICGAYGCVSVAKQRNHANVTDLQAALSALRELVEAEDAADPCWRHPALSRAKQVLASHEHGPWMESEISPPEKSDIPPSPPRIPSLGRPEVRGEERQRRAAEND